MFVTCVGKKQFFLFDHFFLLKQKNDSTSERATAPYFWNFCKIWVSEIISYLRRVRSTCRRTSYVHTEGTENENIRHKNHNFSCFLAISHHSQKPAKNAIFSKYFFFEKKFNKFPFERRVPIALTPHGCLCGSRAVFTKTAQMGGK